jgi:peptidyl-prolyl cis-trans isomerase-like 1
MGKVVVELYWKHAPKNCQNFASLAAHGYYNNTKFQPDHSWIYGAGR